MQNNIKYLHQEIETHLTILQNLAEGIVIADLQGNFVFFNTVAEKILGMGLRQVSPDLWSDVYGIYRSDAVTRYPAEELPLARAIRGDQIQGEILYIKNRERQEGCYISVTANPLKNGNGQIHGGVIIIRDITDNIFAERQLRAVKERLNVQFKGFPVPTYVWRRTGDDFVLIDHNTAAEIVTKGSIKAHLGDKLSGVYTASPDILKDFWRCYHQQTVIKREFTHRLRSSGALRDLIVTYVYLEPDLVMVHAEDITERKQAERELNKLFNAVEQTADIVLITNRQGVIEYINPAFETITGYTREEVLGRNPNILRSDQHDRTFYQRLWQTVLNGEPFMDILVNQKKNGEWFWCEQTITAIKDPEGTITHFVSVAKDITQLRQKQELELQLSVAHKIQQRFARASIELPGFDIFGRTYSAVHTSGDFYDFVPMPDGCVGLVIGDVCGKGIGAALIMAETRAYLRAFAKLESDPAVILNRLNAELFADLEDTQFVTLILARLNPNDRSLLYASAGHGSGYMINRAGKVESALESTGIPLGYIKDWKYKNGAPVELAPGSVLLMMTDGITEAIDAQENEFGDQRAVELVSQNRELASAALIERLYGAVAAYSDKNAQMDDITAVICRMPVSENDVLVH